MTFSGGESAMVQMPPRVWEVSPRYTTDTRRTLRCRVGSSSLPGDRNRPCSGKRAGPDSRSNEAPKGLIPSSPSPQSTLSWPYVDRKSFLQEYSRPVHPSRRRETTSGGFADSCFVFQEGWKPPPSRYASRR